MPATGVPLQRISQLSVPLLRSQADRRTGEIVQSTSYQGFPVVRSESDRTVIGFVRKNELRYAVDRAMRTRHLSSNAICTFQCISPEPNPSNGLMAEPDIVIPGRKSLSRSRSPRHDASSGGVGGGGVGRGTRTSGVEDERVDFGQYIDEVGRLCDRQPVFDSRALES